MDFRSSDHVSCESEHRFIVELLNTRSYEPRGSKKYDLLSAKIRVQLKQFEASVRTLRHKLEEEFNLYPLLLNIENRGGCKFIQYNLDNPISNGPNVWLIWKPLKKLLQYFNVYKRSKFTIYKNIPFRGWFVCRWLFWREEKGPLGRIDPVTNYCAVFN